MGSIVLPSREYPHEELYSTGILSSQQAQVLVRPDSRLHYWLSGPSNSPHVVLIHGAGLDHHMYDAQVLFLARTHRVLTFDLRRHGLSRADAPFDITRAEDDLLALLDHVGAARATLVGTALGGHLAQLFAYHHPERIDGLALLSSSRLTARLTLQARIKHTLAILGTWALPSWLVRAQAANVMTVRREVHSYIVQTMKALSRQDMVAALRAMRDVRIEDANYRLPQPSLVARGSYDRVGWLTETVEKGTDGHGGIKHVVVPGAGYLISQDNPAFCNKMLSDFLYRQVHPTPRKP